MKKCNICRGEFGPKCACKAIKEMAEAYRKKALNALFHAASAVFQQASPCTDENGKTIEYTVQADVMLAMVAEIDKCYEF